MSSAQAKAQDYLSALDKEVCIVLTAKPYDATAKKANNVT